MIIAIDGYEANAAGRVGVGRYAYEIIRTMAHLVNSGKKYGNTRLRIYIPGLIGVHMPEAAGNVEYRNGAKRGLWTFFGFPGLLAKERDTDIVFSPTHYSPRFTSVKRVCAIMDLSYLTYPELFRMTDLFKLKNWSAYSVRHAAHIFTISDFSKNAIMDEYGIPESRITVTYPGLSMDKPKKNFEEVSKRYSIRIKYILAVGTLQPRKNYERLIGAFSHMIDTEHDLIIVGKKGWKFDPILGAPEKHNVSERVHFLDYVSDADLNVLYQHAGCLCMPSLYEGFGLPVVEAMSVGCPVAVSRVSSLPEIAGDAAVYFDPEDVDSIQKGLEKCLVEKNAPEGKKRIASGLKRAGAFTWEKAARKTLDILQSL